MQGHHTPDTMITGNNCGDRDWRQLENVVSLGGFNTPPMMSTGDMALSKKTIPESTYLSWPWEDGMMAIPMRHSGCLRTCLTVEPSSDPGHTTGPTLCCPAPTSPSWTSVSSSGRSISRVLVASGRACPGCDGISVMVLWLRLPQCCHGRVIGSQEMARRRVESCSDSLMMESSHLCKDLIQVFLPVLYPWLSLAVLDSIVENGYHLELLTWPMTKGQWQHIMDVGSPILCLSLFISWVTVRSLSSALLTLRLLSSMWVCVMLCPAAMGGTD